MHLNARANSTKPVTPSLHVTWASGGHDPVPLSQGTEAVQVMSWTSACCGVLGVAPHRLGTAGGPGHRASRVVRDRWAQKREGSATQGLK